MAFPTVSDVTVTKEGSNVGTHNFSMPTGISVGDLLIGFFSTDATETISNMQSGWTAMWNIAPGSGGTGHGWYRIATGSESDGTYDTGTNEQSINVVFLIKNWHGTTPPEASAVDHGGNDEFPDPPSLNPTGWGTEDTLWFALRTHDGAGVATAYPTNFDDNQATDTSGSGGAASMAYCSRENNTETEDPGTFTFSVSDSGVSITVAVRPSSVAAVDKIPNMVEAMLVVGLPGTVGY